MIREREQADNGEEVKDVEKLIAILIKLIVILYFSLIFLMMTLKI